MREGESEEIGEVREEESKKIGNVREEENMMKRNNSQSDSPSEKGEQDTTWEDREIERGGKEKEGDKEDRKRRSAEAYCRGNYIFL